MARKLKSSNVYRDVLPAVDAMPNEVDSAIEQEALEETRQKKTKPDKSKDVDFTSPKIIKKFKFYRKAFLAGYKNLLSLCPQEAAIARVFGISENAFANLKQSDKGVKQAYEDAMKELEPVLTANMLKQAVGYEYTEVKTTYEPKKIIVDERVFKNNLPYGHNKVLIKTKVEKTKKHYPGKPQLFMYYMATHFPEKWKIKPTADGGVHFHITGDLVGKQINDLAGKYLTKTVENEVIENSNSK